MEMVSGSGGATGNEEEEGKDDVALARWSAREFCTEVDKQAATVAGGAADDGEGGERGGRDGVDGGEVGGSDVCRRRRRWLDEVASLYERLRLARWLTKASCRLPSFVLSLCLRIAADSLAQEES
jgi:hypothetical protein